MILGFRGIEYTKRINMSRKFVNNTGNDKVHLKCECVDGNNVKGRRQSISFCFGSDIQFGQSLIRFTNVLHQK